MQRVWLIVKTIKSLEARWLQSVMSGGENGEKKRRVVRIRLMLWALLVVHDRLSIHKQNHIYICVLAFNNLCLCCCSRSTAFRLTTYCIYWICCVYLVFTYVKRLFACSHWSDHKIKALSTSVNSTHTLYVSAKHWNGNRNIPRLSENVWCLEL